MPFSKLFQRAPRPWTARRVPLNQARLRVLVVDDNHDAALAMTVYLSLEDIESRAVFGGRGAIDLAPEWAPHIILIDIQMPACNGIEAARMLRRDPRTNHIAIIAYTALDETELRRQLVDDEFDGYLQKGRDLSQLIQLLKTFTQADGTGSGTRAGGVA